MNDLKLNYAVPAQAGTQIIKNSGVSHPFRLANARHLPIKGKED